MISAIVLAAGASSRMGQAKAALPFGQTGETVVARVVRTLLITFDNLPDNTGWEGTAQARIYTRVDEANPALGTIGYAFPASLFFESAHETTVATIRDTTPDAVSGGTQGSQRTNIGVFEIDRIELKVGTGRPGYSRVNGALLPLTTGARLDEATGVFTWQPGVGYLGAHDFVLGGRDVRVVLNPKGSGRVGPQRCT